MAVGAGRKRADSQHAGRLGDEPGQSREGPSQPAHTSQRSARPSLRPRLLRCTWASVPEAATPAIVSSPSVGDSRRRAGKRRGAATGKAHGDQGPMSLRATRRRRTCTESAEAADAGARSLEHDVGVCASRRDVMDPDLDVHVPRRHPRAAAAGIIPSAFAWVFAMLQHSASPVIMSRVTFTSFELTMVITGSPRSALRREQISSKGRRDQARRRPKRP